MEKCCECHKKPIYIKKWGLCANCYTTLRRHGKLPIFKRATIYEKRAAMRLRLTKKYGHEILEDFELLFTKPFWNHKAIAEKYGISRERVRQLFKALYGKEWRKVNAKKKIAIQKEIKSMGGRCHPLNRMAGNDKDTYVYRGAVGEWAVMQKAQDIGLQVKPVQTRNFDLLISNIPVEVKCCSIPFKTSDINHKGYWRFRVQNDRNQSVFTILYVKPKKQFYILPTRILSGPQVYIRVDEADDASDKTYKGRKPAIDFQKYKERWDYLEPPSYIDLCSEDAA